MKSIEGARRRAAAQDWGCPGVAAELTAALARADRAVNGFLGSMALSGTPVRTACRRGCSACCKQTVLVGEPEALHIRHFMASLPRARQEELRRRVRATAAATEDLSPDERRERQVPCAFLDADGGCAIYPARPFNCRQLVAVDASACRDSIARPQELQARIVAGLASPPHVKNVSRLVAAEAWRFYQGLERRGYAPRSSDVAAAVDRLLDGALDGDTP